MRRNNCLIVMLALFLLAFSQFNSIYALYNTQDTTIHVLVIHSGDGGLSVVTQAFSNNSQVSVDSILISQIETTDISNYNIIILTSSTTFETSSATDTKLLNFINQGHSVFMAFTPYLGHFEDPLKLALGLQNTDKVLPEDNSTANWQLQTTQKIGTMNSGTVFNYTGNLLEFEASSGVQTLVQATSGSPNTNGLEELDYPFPVIVNASTSSEAIITSSIPVNSQNLRLYGFLDLFEQLITQIINVSVSFQTVQSGSSSSTNPTTTGSNQNTSPNNNILPPNINLLPILAVLAFVLFMLFFKQILGFFRWLSEKTLGIGIAILGIFYNVQERILDDNDVLLNQYRIDIMKYLDYVGSSGAHLREIKSTLKSGTGSLLWHLQVLEDFNWVIKVKVDKYVVFVSHNYIDQFDTNLKHIELALQSKNTDLIMEAILDEPHLEYDINQLQEMTGIYRKAIRRFIAKLQEFNLIEIINDNPITFRLLDKATLETIHNNLISKQEFSLDIDSQVNVSRSD